MAPKPWIECIIDRVNHQMFEPRKVTRRMLPQMFFSMLAKEHKGDHCAMARAVLDAITAELRPGEAEADEIEDADHRRVQARIRDQLAKAYPLPDYHLEFDLLGMCRLYCAACTTFNF
jgi:hypothetical protein